DVIIRGTVKILLMMRAEVFPDHGVPIRSTIPFMNCYAFTFVIDLHQSAGVYNLDLVSYVGVRNTVIVPVFGETDMTVFSDCIFAVLFDFKVVDWQWP